MSLKMSQNKPVAERFDALCFKMANVKMLLKAVILTSKILI